MELHSECVVGGTLFVWYTRWCVPKLFKLADSGNWNKISSRCRRHPKEAKFIHKYAPRDTALHRILRPLRVPYAEECDRETKQKEGLLECEDSGIVTSNGDDDADGCSKSESDFAEDAALTELLTDAVEAILACHPRAAHVPNIYGRTPLHLACMGELTQSRTAAALILLQPPISEKFVSLRDRDGRTAFELMLNASDRSGNTNRNRLLKAFESLKGSTQPEQDTRL